jgi:hypothetical protein
MVLLPPFKASEPLTVVVPAVVLPATVVLPAEDRLLVPASRSWLNVEVAPAAYHRPGRRLFPVRFQFDTLEPASAERRLSLQPAHAIIAELETVDPAQPEHAALLAHRTQRGERDGRIEQLAGCRFGGTARPVEGSLACTHRVVPERGDCRTGEQEQDFEGHRSRSMAAQPEVSTWWKLTSIAAVAPQMYRSSNGRT